MITIRENVPLASYTYFKIGGPARFFVETRSTEELREALEFARKRDVPFWILGGGSNVLINDNGLPGLVIRVVMNDIHVDEEKIICGAGVAMARAVAESVKHGLAGFEWAIGIPGTIGGSVRGNAGCFGGEMTQALKRVRVLKSKIKNPKSKIFEFNNDHCKFAYRESIFKHDSSLIILSATLQLKKGSPEESKKLIAQYAEERTQKQDIGAQCAGCMFKNFTPPNGGTVIHAGWLIDTAGCKGMRIGNAVVSEKHANYFVNLGGATAADVRALAARIKKEVKTFHGVLLEEEIQYLCHLS